MIAGAVRETASVLRDRILAIAAHKLEAAVEDIEFVDSRATVRGVPNVGITLKEIAEISYFQAETLPSGVPPGLESSGRYHSPSMMLWPTPATSARARSTSRPGP